MPESLIDRYIRESERRDPPPYVSEPQEEPADLFYNRQLSKIPAPEIAKDPPVTLEAARAHIASQTTAYLDQDAPAHMLVIAAAPGVGKTVSAVRTAEALAQQGKRVLYAGPRHDLFQDLMAIADHAQWWLEWLPRQKGDPDTGKLETCREAQACDTWLARGYKGMDFCKRICGWDYINGGCPYHAQKRTKAPCIYGQHQHVTLGHPLQFDVVIGDENPVPVFCREWAIPAQWIMPSGIDPERAIAPVLHELARVAEAGLRLEGQDLLRVIGGAKAVRTACEDYMPLSASVIPPEIHRPDQVDKIPYAHLQYTTTLLAREAAAAEKDEEYLHRVIVANKKLLLLLRHPTNERLPSHVIWLDATANKHLYEACFRRPVEIVHAQPEIQGKIYQVYDRVNGKASLMDKAGKATHRVEQSEDQVKRIIDLKGYQAPAVITYQKTLDGSAYLNALPHAHFYAARGTNFFQENDAMVIVGAPQPPLGSILTMARMIFWERMTPFDNSWRDREIPYNHIAEDGTGRSYPASGYWDDLDLNAVLWSLREAEIIQAAHRCRPVNHPADIWLLTNIPIDELPPTELLSIRELFGAPEDVNAFMWPKVVALAEEINGRLGMVKATDFVSALGVDPRTARKYVERLIKHEGWRGEAASTVRTRGRPSQCATKGDAIAE